ncbi:MAG: lipopolysaccharide heptosyltransferase family protein [Ignavibacteria bacterium]|nr:lipopolysaccharide heptosyltransferase family protein [Ignavibacteria bacterium]
MTKAKKKTRSRKPQLTIPDCKHFTGYKPCFPDTHCYEECVDLDPIGTTILIVNLDAMGNVLVTTSLLPAIKRKYPESYVTWITLRNAAPLLDGNAYIDKVYIWEPESWLILQQMKFDVVMNVDKSQRSCAFTMGAKAKEKLGFGLNENGVIVPLNSEALENYILGLDDNVKFRVNQKPASQILCETLKLQYKRDEYMLNLTSEEAAFCLAYKEEQGIRDEDVVVGFNTGCSTLYPNKKMTVDQHVTLIKRISKIPGLRLALVGGPEDTERNAEIARQVGRKVINTPTTEGVRRGLCYINICDVIISGDSFGMHAAIGLKKYVIVWFGVSCWTEVDLLERGEKLIPEGLECSPCWKHECPYNLECIQMIDLDAIVHYVERYKSQSQVLIPTT